MVTCCLVLVSLHVGCGLAWNGAARWERRALLLLSAPIHSSSDGKGAAAARPKGIEGIRFGSVRQRMTRELSWGAMSPAEYKAIRAFPERVPRLKPSLNSAIIRDTASSRRPRPGDHAAHAGV